MKRNCLSETQYRPNNCFMVTGMLMTALFIGLIVSAEEVQESPWNLDSLSRIPVQYAAEGFDEPGVQALFYTAEPFKGQETRVFAWYGAPKKAAGEKSPGMVLVHGGGGTAFAEWVRLWVNRGYCAIAMDTCGCVPRGVYGNWERHAQGGPAGWGGFDQIDEPVKDQWTYHAVADILLAHSLLRSFPEVDPERTGITGISWGGYLTCISAGVDPRFKFAVPVYGCGFLGDNSAWTDTFQNMPEGKASSWLKLWDPSVYLPHAAMPMLWVTGTNDFAYPMDSLQKSYRLPTADRTLCIRIRMPHGHGGAGENPEEIRVFADNILKSGESLPAVTERGHEENRAWLVYTSKTPLVQAELIYTKDKGKWQDRLWESLPAVIEQNSHKVSALIPDGAKVFYMNLTDERGCVISSEHEELNSPE
jgi:dienelactone hydrolase